MQDISKCFEEKKFALPVTGVEENSLPARGHFLLTRFVPFLNKKFKDFSRTFKDTFRIFKGLHAVQKRAWSLSFFVLPHHEKFYPEGLSVFASFPLQFSLNFSVSIEIQELSSTDCNLQGFSRCVRTLA